MSLLDEDRWLEAGETLRLSGFGVRQFEFILEPEFVCASLVARAELPSGPVRTLELIDGIKSAVINGSCDGGGARNEEEGDSSGLPKADDSGDVHDPLEDLMGDGGLLGLIVTIVLLGEANEAPAAELCDVDRCRPRRLSRIWTVGPVVVIFKGGGLFGPMLESLDHEDEFSRDLEDEVMRCLPDKCQSKN